MRRVAATLPKCFSIECLDRLVAYLTLAGACGLVIWGAIELANTFYGDPSIYLSYAQQIAAGDFFSFNPGEFSSGTTSPLWALILGAGFALGGGVGLAKAICALVSVLAVYMTFRLSLRVSGSFAGSGAGALLVATYLVLPGNLLYESGLAVVLSCVIGTLTCRLAGASPGWQRSRFWLLAAAWSVMPLVRPDSYIVVAWSLVLILWLRRHAAGEWKHMVAGVLVSSVPTILYFGYSHFTLGSWSVSSYCRMFALREGASVIFGFPYSTATLELFCAFPTYWWAVFALFGMAVAVRRQIVSPRCTLFVLVIPVAYLFVQTVVVPVGAGADRYFLPAWPYVTAVAALGVGAIMQRRRKEWVARLMLLAIVLCSISLLKHSSRRVASESQRGLTLDVIVEREIVEWLNQTVESGAVILMYEVQDRFYLRADVRVLSLDGITDGKIEPYLESGDVMGFIRAYRPDYWLANDAIAYRPYLRNSPLFGVVEQTRLSGEESLTVEGVTFTPIRARDLPMPEGFAGYRQVYRLSYDS